MGAADELDLQRQPKARLHPLCERNHLASLLVPHHRSWNQQSSPLQRDTVLLVQGRGLNAWLGRDCLIRSCYSSWH